MNQPEKTKKIRDLITAEQKYLKAVKDAFPAAEEAAPGIGSFAGDAPEIQKGFLKSPPPDSI